MRSAASCAQPLQLIAAPRGALTCRLRVLMTGGGVALLTRATARRYAAPKVSNLETYARVVKWYRKISYLTSAAHARSTEPSATTFAIHSMSGDGGRSRTSIGTRVRTYACTAARAADVASGASRSIAWHASRISTAITREESSRARSALNAPTILMLT